MRKKIIIIAVLTILCLLPLCADEVGTVISFSGPVLIDAFGNGTFIDVVENDVLYPESVLKTGNSAYVVIKIGNLTNEIGPDQLIILADLISHEQDKEWLKSIMLTIGNILDYYFIEEDTRPFGARGDKNNDELFKWEDELNHELNDIKTIKEKIKQKKYNSALDLTTEKDNTDDPEVVTEEIQYLKGYCYFQLKDYEKADEYLSTLSMNLTEAIKSYTSEDKRAHSQLLMLGLSNYLTNDYEQAIIYLKDLLKLYKKNKEQIITPYIHWILVDAYNAIGDKQQANKYMKLVDKAFKNTQLEEKFNRYLDTIK